GVIAQVTNLGVPYLMRAAMLVITFIVAFVLMHDEGFTPRKGESVGKEMRKILKASFDHGLRKPPVRWVMLAAPFSAGVGFYAFYAMQPYLLQLYGKTGSYAIAGLAAAIVAGAQVAGGFLVPYIRRAFKRRTSVLLTGTVLSAGALACIGIVSVFWLALVILVIWAIVFAAVSPIRQAYLNDLIPSEQRATVLSSDNLLGSSGGVVIQPGLGKVADLHGYGASYVVGAGVQLLSLPLLLLARREKVGSDFIIKESPPETPPVI
ncbi:MAG TPA: MFS transporter, partial [Candidatus Saccharimonadales bacterium]|nr:MFS transporter [Candidatus Saccharimonadales bacterium]